MSHLSNPQESKKLGSFPSNFNLANLTNAQGYFFNATGNKDANESPGMVLEFTLNGRPAIAIGNINGNDGGGQAYFYYTDVTLPFIINPYTYLNGQTGFTFNGTNLDGTCCIGTSFTYIPNFSGDRPVLVIGSSNQLFGLYTNTGNFPQYITEAYFDGTNGFVFTNLDNDSKVRQVITLDVNNDGKSDLVTTAGESPAQVVYASTEAFPTSSNINDLLNGITGFNILASSASNSIFIGSRNCNGAELLIGNSNALNGNGQVYGLKAQPSFPANFYVPDNITALNGYIVNGTANSNAGNTVAGIQNLVPNDNCDAIAISIPNTLSVALLFGPAPFPPNVLEDSDSPNVVQIVAEFGAGISMCTLPGNPNNNGYNSLFFGIPFYYSPNLQAGILYGQESLNGTININEFSGSTGATISSNQTGCGMSVASVTTGPTSIPTLAISAPDGSVYFVYYPVETDLAGENTQVA
jgi:hypothetical protein